MQVVQVYLVDEIISTLSLISDSLTSVYRNLSKYNRMLCLSSHGARAHSQPRWSRPAPPSAPRAASCSMSVSLSTPFSMTLTRFASDFLTS